VRFIYARPMDDYLSVAERDGQIGFPINDELDLSWHDAARQGLRCQKHDAHHPFATSRRRNFDH
jgi:predicted nucleotidyltransferase